MKVKDICNPDCLLFLWTSSPHLPQAIELMESWGFKYMTIAFVWDKQKLNPGYYTMSQIEICLVGKRGKIPTPRGTRNERQFLSEMRTAHSKKPDEIRERIHKMFPTQKKLEMFARQPSPNFDVFGNQVENSINLIQSQ
jgi:N6-adenosine-specific RNA methylase IME4